MRSDIKRPSRAARFTSEFTTLVRSTVLRPGLLVCTSTSRDREKRIRWPPVRTESYPEYPQDQPAIYSLKVPKRSWGFTSLLRCLSSRTLERRRECLNLWILSHFYGGMPWL